MFVKAVGSKKMKGRACPDLNLSYHMINSDCKSHSYAHPMVFNKLVAKPRWPPESLPKSILQWLMICPMLCESFVKKTVLVFQIR